MFLRYVQYLAGCRDSNSSGCDCSQVCYHWAKHFFLLLLKTGFLPHTMKYWGVRLWIKLEKYSSIAGVWGEGRDGSLWQRRYNCIFYGMEPVDQSTRHSRLASRYFLISYTWTRRDAVYSLLYTDNSSGKRACCAFTKFLPKGQLIMVERAVHSLNSYRKVSWSW